MNPKSSAARPAGESTPWWRVGMVWLVLGGPAVVVAAGIATAVIAYTNVEPVIDTSQAHTSAERAASIREAAVRK